MKGDLYSKPVTEAPTFHHPRGEGFGVCDLCGAVVYGQVGEQQHETWHVQLGLSLDGLHRGLKETWEWLRDLERTTKKKRWTA